VVGWEAIVGGNSDGWLLFFFPSWMGGWDGDLVIMDYDKDMELGGKHSKFLSLYPYLFWLLIDQVPISL